MEAYAEKTFHLLLFFQLAFMGSDLKYFTPRLALMELRLSEFAEKTFNKCTVEYK